MASKPF